eukprot:gene447-295_t
MSTKKKKTKAVTVERESNEDLSDGNEEPDTDEEDTYRDPPEGCVHLRPSVASPYIPSTIFVEYPPQLKMQRKDAGYIEELGERKMGYKSHWERICIRNAFVRAGFKKSSKYWTALWSKHQNSSQLEELSCLQKVNHFPSSWCIGRKDRLSRTLNIMKRLHGNALFDYHPDTYIMPSDMDIFVRLLKLEIQAAVSGRKSSEGFWIMKPVASSCGRAYEPQGPAGSTTEAKSTTAPTSTAPSAVSQPSDRSNPADTAKVDDVDSEDDGNDDDVQENDPSAVPNGTDSNNPEMEGYKWSLHAFKAWLSAQYSPQIMQETFQRIYDIIIKTMVAMEGEITPLIQRSGVNYRTNCFELFGCDVILDENLQPHLLEVNVSPSLMGSSPLDKRIKGMLIADVLHTVGMYPYDPVLLRKYDGVKNDDNNDYASSASGSAVAARRKSLLSGSAAGAAASKRASSAVSSAASTVTNSSRQSEEGTVSTTSNPFAFSNLSRLMASQEAYRRDPCSDSIDLDALAAQPHGGGGGIASASFSSSASSAMNDQSGQPNSNNNNWWQILVLIEDEMHRAKTGGFIQVHPVLPARPLPSRVPTAELVADIMSPVLYPGEYYLSLYRNARFHDHLLYKWLSLGGCRGKAGQRYLPRYVYSHIRNNLESQQVIYAGLQQVGHALFYDPNNIPAATTVSTSNHGNASKRRTRSLSNPASSRPSSATMRPTTPSNKTATATATNGYNYGGYIGGSMQTLRDLMTPHPNEVASTAPPPVSVVTTTTLTMSPSGHHLQQQIHQQTIAASGTSIATVANTTPTTMTASLPPKARPSSSSRGRSYTSMSNLTPAAVSSIDGGTTPVIPTEKSPKAALSATHDPLVVHIGSTPPSMEPLGSSSVPSSPAAAMGSLPRSGSSSSTATSPKARFINPNVNRNSSAYSRPVSSSQPSTTPPPTSQLSTASSTAATDRKQAVSAAAAAATAAFAYAYGLDPTMTSKMMKATQGKPHHHPLSSSPLQASASQPVQENDHTDDAQHRRRSLSAPSTSRALLVSSNDASTTGSSTATMMTPPATEVDATTIATAGVHGHGSHESGTMGDVSSGTGAKVLDILRQRRHERQTQQSQLSQLRDYEEKLAMQIYEQQEHFALQQRWVQQQRWEQQQHQQQSERLAKDVAKIKAISQAQQLTANNMAVLQAATGLLRNPAPSAGASSMSAAATATAAAATSARKPSQGVKTSSALSSSSSPLAKHLQWQQQQQELLLMAQHSK